MPATPIDSLNSAVSFKPHVSRPEGSYLSVRSTNQRETTGLVRNIMQCAPRLANTKTHRRHGKACARPRHHTHSLTHSLTHTHTHTHTHTPPPPHPTHQPHTMATDAPATCLVGIHGCARVSEEQERCKEAAYKCGVLLVQLPCQHTGRLIRLISFAKQSKAKQSKAKQSKAKQTTKQTRRTQSLTGRTGGNSGTGMARDWYELSWARMARRWNRLHSCSTLKARMRENSSCHIFRP